MTRTRSWPAIFLVLTLGAAGLFLAIFLLQDDPSEPDPNPERTAALSRPRLHSGRVPRLRVAPAQTGSPASTPPPAAQPVPARSRMAPLVSLYWDFVEQTELPPSTLREVRRILHQMQESFLRGEQLAAQRLGEPASTQARREKAYADMERELREQIRPEQADRVLAHALVQELFSVNEPLFQANPRGIVTLREDLRP